MAMPSHGFRKLRVNRTTVLVAFVLVTILSHSWRWNRTLSTNTRFDSQVPSVADSSILEPTTHSDTTFLPVWHKQQLRLVVHLLNGTQNCWLDGSPDRLLYLGFGKQGHAFAADLLCDKETPRERVVFKLSTYPIQEDNSTSPKTFVPTSPGEILSKELLYHRLRQQDATDAAVKSRFAVHLGTVNVPSDFLQQAMNMVNQKETKPNGHIVPNWSQDNTILATVSVLAPGRDLESLRTKEQLILDPGRRRAIVKALVEMHRFLALRQVWHGDLSMRHVHFDPSTNHTTLIDFDLFVLLDQILNTTIGGYGGYREGSGVDKFRHFAVLEEAALLLRVLSMVCGQLEDLPKSRNRSWKKFPKMERNDKKRWKNELQECGFHPDGTTANSSKNVQDAFFKAMGRRWENKTVIEEYYRALERWVGLEDAESTTIVESS